MILEAENYSVKTLFLITARGGSKGIPKKNIKKLCGKPLLFYSIDVARELTTDDNIFVSTDSEEIQEVVESFGLPVPFLRPSEFAEDGSGSFDVIKHVLDTFKGRGIHYDRVVLLQPTSPLREKHHLEEAIHAFEETSCEAIYSVQIADATPTYRLYKEENGVLRKCEESNVFQRQMDSVVYKTNGSIYVFDASVFYKLKSLSEIKKIAKYLMPKQYSFEIDDMIDFNICEMLINEGQNR